MTELALPRSRRFHVEPPTPHWRRAALFTVIYMLLATVNFATGNPLSTGGCAVLIGSMWKQLRNPTKTIRFDERLWLLGFALVLAGMFWPLIDLI